MLSIGWRFRCRQKIEGGEVVSARMPAELKQRLLDMARQGMPDPDIAKALNVSRSTVCNQRRRAKIPIATHF